MELWIRSQDRERLIKVFDVFVDDERIRANFQSHFNGCNYVELGEYYSNDRAEEVLDEIQKYIVEKNILANCNCILTLANSNSKDAAEAVITRSEQIAVYQMPKK